VVLIARRFALVLCSFAGLLLFSVPVAVAVTPPVVEDEAVLDVAGTSATLRAKIDPEGSETTYRFEYGTGAAYGSSIPVPDGLVGSGSVGVAVSAHPQDLVPGTAYHYRVVALVASRSETVPGGDGTFTTQPAGGEFALPDGRQWELVSPPNKHGALIGSLSDVGRPLQASDDGSGITYDANVPTAQDAQGYSAEEQVLSERGMQGWSSRDIGPPHASLTGVSSLFLPEYNFFSSDLSSSLVFPQGEDVTQGESRTLLSDRASEPTPYVRREALCDAPSSTSECYLPVLTGKEGFADVPPGTKFGAEQTVRFQGASPDMRHVVMVSNVALTATPIPAVGVYEWSAGVLAGEALQLVNVLPESEGGGPAQGGTVGEFQPEYPASRHAISNDGSRIFWELTIGQGHGFYMRDTVKKETARLDVRQPGVPIGSEPATEFQIASSDGSRVFFTDQDQDERLTPGSGTQGKDLYECEIVEEAGRLKCDLTDLTPESGGLSAEVQGHVLGASEEGSYVYFTANGVLGDAAERGATRGTCRNGDPQVGETCNLYEYHNGATTFIATLSSGDYNAWTETAHLAARVSPNGRYAAFMSERSLTGYDNRDASSAKPDMEVYLYDAVTKRLACVSCNPTGARPAGVEVGEFNTRPNLVAVQQGGVAPAYGAESWVGANLPAGVKLAGNQSLYQPRLLFDSGRLFFNSSDALVPQDVNGQEDVYEFEQQGMGGCTASSVTFDPKSGGCVGLVSSGASSEESGFMDASESGGDVFFLTTSRLTSRDFDTSLDVYDAHECSASVPCVAQPVSTPPCSSGDSCKTAPALQPSVFGAPPSATFAGAGNIVGSSSRPVVKGKSLTRGQKLARALRACRKKPKRGRAACKRQARRRYGANAARRATWKGQG
jgi:hypothetical protein